MARSITMRPGENANGDVGNGQLLGGQTYSNVSSALAHDLVNRGKADWTLPQSGAQEWIGLHTDYTVTARDHGKTFEAMGPVTVTVPDGLVPRPTVAFMAPPSGSGNLSINGRLNGTAVQTLTRAIAANPNPLVLKPNGSADNYVFPGV